MSKPPSHHPSMHTLLAYWRKLLQRIALRLDGSASCVHESILVGPQREDSRCRPWTRDVQRGGCPYLRGWHLFGQALRPQSPTRRVTGSRNSTWQEKEARREGAKLLEEDLHTRPAVSYEQRAEFLCPKYAIALNKSYLALLAARHVLRRNVCKGGQPSGFVPT